ncbi:MAG: DHHW family protein [Oscillospiraceae bacterium]|nr:DHHW family protein [Oscillospiraceae bacterium]
MKKVNLLSFLAILLVLSLVVLLAPADTSISERENRSVAKFPEITTASLLNGDFGRQFEEWLADQVAFRSEFISVSMSITEAMGVTPPVMGASSTISNPSTGSPVSPVDETNNAPLLGSDDNNQSTQADTNESDSNIDSTQTPVVERVKYIIPEGVGRYGGWLLSFDDRIMEVFIDNPSATELYSDIINQYRISLGENTRIFSLLIPSQFEFIPEIYTSLGDPQIETINAAYSQMVDGITPIDAYGALSQHLDEYIYYRTDHHWTALGAYYVYEAFAHAAGIDPIPLSEYDVSIHPDFLGYLFNQSPSDVIKDKPDTIYAYEYKGTLETSIPLLIKPDDNNQVASYHIFLGGDHDIFTIDTSVDNGKTAVIIKDSYANCFIPWLAPHYERIIIIDPRTYEGSVSDIISLYDEVDLIFLNYVFLISYATEIEKILNVL